MKYWPPFGDADPDAPYVDGNPGTGTEGSIVPAGAIEQPQRELIAILTAAGMTPNEAVLDQVLEALLALFMPRTPTSWRMWVSSTSVPAGATTTLGGFTQSFGQQIDSVINLTAGTVTIGAEDAGAYLLGASFGSNGNTDTERVHIVYNGTTLAVSGGVSPSDTSELSQSVLVFRYLNAGDILSAAFFQNNSGAAARNVDNRGGFFGLRIGDV